MDNLVNALYIGKQNGVAEFGGEELCQSGSESIHKSFRKDNKSITVWLSLIRINLQCGYCDKTVKSLRHVQLPNSKSYTVTRREPEQFARQNTKGGGGDFNECCTEFCRAKQEMHSPRVGGGVQAGSSSVGNRVKRQIKDVNVLI